MKHFLLGVALTYLFFLFLVAFSYGSFLSLTVKPIETLDYLVFRQNLNKTKLPEWFFFPQINNKTGTTIHEEAKIWGDLTLFSAADAQNVRLINNKGKVVHKWNAYFSKIWPNPTHLLNPVPEQHITLYRTFLAPEMNGDLYMMFAGNGDIQSRYGLAKLNKDGGVLWRYPKAAHHDMAFTADHKILIFVDEVQSKQNPALSQILPPFLESYIAILDQDGQELKRVSLLDALLESPAAGFLKTLHAQPQDAMMSAGDLLHPNTITLIPEHVIGKAPMLKANSALLSFRNIDLLAIINLETWKIDWASFGSWKGQHSPRFMDNGHIVMFDNFGNIAEEGGASRIIEVDLATSGIVWDYNGTKKDPLFSPYNAMIQILPNENILVTETHSGRLFEVSRAKEIVWEYYAPNRYYYKGGIAPLFDPDTPRIPSLFSAMRYKKSDLEFLEDTP